MSGKMGSLQSDYHKTFLFFPGDLLRQRFLSKETIREGWYLTDEPDFCIRQSGQFIELIFEGKHPNGEFYEKETKTICKFPNSLIQSKHPMFLKRTLKKYGLKKPEYLNDFISDEQLAFENKYVEVVVTHV